MNNSSRGKKALAGLITLTAFLMSAFVIPQKAFSKTPADTHPDTPAAPYNLRAVLSGPRALLYWNFAAFGTNDPNAPKRTVIYRSEDGSNFSPKYVLPVVTSIFTDSDVVAGKTYFYKISYTRDVPSLRPGSPPGTAESGDSNTASVIVPSGLTPPVLLALTARATDSKTIELSWNGDFEVLDYKIYRKTSGGLFSLLLDNYKGTSLIDTKVELNTEYSYYVVPRTVSGLKSSSDVVMVKTPSSVVINIDPL